MTKEIAHALLVLYKAGIELDKETLAALVPEMHALIAREMPEITNPATAAKHFCGFSEHGYYDFVRRHPHLNKFF